MGDLACCDSRIYLELAVRRVQCRRCGTVKQEGLGWLADHPFYTKRFAFWVGRRCRGATIKDVAGTRQRARCLPTPRPTASPGSLPARAAPAPPSTRGIVKFAEEAKNS